MDWHITAFTLGFIALDLLTGFALWIRARCATAFGTNADSS